MAEQISVAYAGKDLLAVGVLKGCWVFLADLVRLLTVPVAVDFMLVSSYGDRTASLGEVELVLDLRTPIVDRDVLVVEDILDSGHTLRSILATLRRRNPSSLKVAALMDKPTRRRVDIRADFVGFEVPDRFVVGYGVDYAERFRHLPYIGYLEEPKPKG